MNKDNKDIIIDTEEINGEQRLKLTEKQLISMLKDLTQDQESFYIENLKRLEYQKDKEIRQQDLRLEEIKLERDKSNNEKEKFTRMLIAITLGVIGVLLAFLITITVLFYGTTFVIDANSNAEANNYSTNITGNENSDIDTTNSDIPNDTMETEGLTE